jgi:sugar lactone lactonase YvrE
VTPRLDLGADDVVVPGAGDLCEGPQWDERTRRLVWVDILQGRVHEADATGGHHVVHELGVPVGAVAPRRRGGWVAAVERGFQLFDEQWRPHGPLVPAPGQRSGTRFNDGACDPDGRFWAGTLAYDETPRQGALYRLGADGTCAEVLTEVTNSNGLGWSPDGTTFYYVDTGRGTLDVMTYDRRTGAVADRRTLVTVPEKDGLPDGLTVDLDGHLWLALWGGGSVRRYSPDGDLELVVALPVTNVTSIAFGGPDLTDLFVTTARQGIDAVQRRREPLAGSVFRCRPRVTGRPRATFAG